MDASHPIAWPVTTIDMEASALSPESYPIEIGIARWKGPGRAASSWSVLIRPTDEQLSDGCWDAASARIHGIEQRHLARGVAPADAMRALNALCPPGTLALCDGGRFDAHWIERLSAAAGIPPALHLGSWGRFARTLGEDVHDAIGRAREARTNAHRAAEDAEDHLRDLAAALGVRAPGFSRIVMPPARTA